MTDERAADRPGGRSALKAVASTIGVCVGVSGLDHGLFEVLQGNVATPGVFVQAIGPAQRMWAYGTEEAFTIAPSFLAAGIATLVMAVLTIVWSLRSMDRPMASWVLLALGGLQFLFGGGVGMVVFLVFGWAVARRVHRPFTWWRGVVPAGLSALLARRWKALLGTSLVLYAFALEVAIAGVVPGVSDPRLVRQLCWTSLLAMLGALALATVGASAHDLAGAPCPGCGSRQAASGSPSSPAAGSSTDSRLATR